MYKIAIAEDHIETQKLMQHYFLKYKSEYNQEITLFFFPNGKELVDQYQTDFDLILLDIEMPQMDGMTAARKIRERDNQVIIIFITNIAHYAIKGYEVQAMDFVLKPLNYIMFAMKIENALKMAGRKQEKSITVMHKGGMRKIKNSELYYVEVTGHYLCYHTISGNYKVLGTLREVENELGTERFARCNNCYLVNLQYVSAITPNTVKVAEDELQMSRPRKKQFMQAVADFMGGV